MARFALAFSLCALAASRAVAQPECAIDADEATIPELEVRAPGHAPFQVDARGVHASVTPTERTAASRVRIEGVLAFDGVGRIALRPTGALELHGGSVRLTENARVVRYRRHREGLVGEVELAAGVSATLVLPCDALTVDEPIRPVTTTPSVVAGTAVWTPRGRRLALMPLGAAEPLVLSADFALALPFELVRRRGARMLVEAEWADGTRIAGWTSERALRANAASGWGGTADWGTPSCGARGSCGGPNVYCGPATIADGSTVYATAGASPWALVRDGQREVHVHLVRGSGWARITWMPDLSQTDSCDAAPPAFVSEAAVRIP